MTSRRRGLGGRDLMDETRLAPLDDDLLGDPLIRDATQPSISSLDTRVAPLDVPTLDERPEPGDDPIRTTFSNQAALLTDVLRERFGSKMFGRMPRRILRVDELESPSTAGGRLARQAISLVPRKGAAPTLVCGWMDVATREALLRSYQSLAARHEARHGYPIDLPREEYERFLNELVDALILGGIRVRVMVPEEKEGAQPPSQAERVRSAPLWQVLLLASLAFTAGLWAERTAHLTERLLSGMPIPGAK